MNDAPTCRHCGAYLHLHGQPGSPVKCNRPKIARWRHQHYLWRHLFVTAWWALSEDHRWRIAERLSGDNNHWCAVVDSLIRAWPEYRSDYRGDMGCKCDFPLPWGNGASPSGGCYCTPPQAGLSAAIVKEEGRA